MRLGGDSSWVSRVELQVGVVSGLRALVTVVATLETSLRKLWMLKDSKGTRRQVEEAFSRYHPV